MALNNEVADFNLSPSLFKCVKQTDLTTNLLVSPPWTKQTAPLTVSRLQDFFFCIGLTSGIDERLLAAARQDNEDLLLEILKLNPDDYDINCQDG